jgi:hypothetical protein
MQEAEIGRHRAGSAIVTQPGGSKLTFIHDPWGTSIEANERPNPLEQLDFFYVRPQPVAAAGLILGQDS